MGVSQHDGFIGQDLSGGRYRVDVELGKGGMGVVYRAWDNNLGTEVVIKVPHAAMLQDAEFATRFSREIRSLVALSHPHIVKISDVGEADGLPFAVMQFLPGGSLEDRQRSEADGEIHSLLPDSLEAWLPSVAEALDFVHQQGYIHRDVKPANILFDAHGHAYLSDFGIAKLAAATEASAGLKNVTGAGLVIGTPEYMAPELIMGHSINGRADQYSLAVTVFEILAGRRPFEDATSTAVLVQHSTKEPPDLAKLSPNVPVSLASAIRQALSKSPNDRFASCVKFADAVLDAVSTRTKSSEAKAKCPACQKVLKLSDKVRGKEVKCPNCTVALRVSDDLRQLSELKPDKNVSGTRIVGTPGATPEGTDGSEDVYRLSRDHGEATAIKVEVAAPAATKQETAAVRQPESRTKASPQPVPKNKEIELQRRVLPAKVADQKPPGGIEKWLLVAVGSTAIVFLCVTIFVMTAGGTVKITLQGGDDSVHVNVDGNEIAISGLNEPIKLNVGEHGLKVTSPNFETVTKSFKVTRGGVTVVAVELTPKISSTPPTVVSFDTPVPGPADKPCVYNVELIPPQAAFSVEGDGVTIAGAGPQRTVSVANPQTTKSLVLVARLPGFQEIRLTLKPVPGASEAITLKLQPVSMPVAAIPGSPGSLPPKSSVQSGSRITNPRTPAAKAIAASTAIRVQLDSDQIIYQRTTLKLRGSLLGVPNDLQSSLVVEADFGEGNRIESVDIAPDMTFQLEQIYPTPGEYTVTVVVSAPNYNPVKATALVNVREYSPVPDAVALERSRKTVHQLFKKEFENANKSATRIELSENLIEQGLNTTDDPAGRYVLFEEAAKQAAEATEPSLAFRAVDEIAKTFDINPHSMKAKLLALTVEKTKFTSLHKKAAEAGLFAFESALQNDEFAAAAELLNVAKTAAEAGKELGLAKKRETAFERLAARNKASDRSNDARKVLEMSEDDPAANHDWGSYLCFVKGQWNSGLPFLVKGPSGPISELAALDIKRSKTTDEQLAVADGWKGLADGTDAVFGYQQQRRAAMWYRRVVAQLQGLSRKRVEEVLTQLDTLAAAAPESMTSNPVLPIRNSQIENAIKLIKKIGGATFNGKWSLDDGTLENLEDLSSIALPIGISGSYSFSVEIQRKSGSEGMFIYLPVAERGVLFGIGQGGQFSGGNHHSLNLVQGETLKKAGTIPNGQWVKVNADVTVTGKKARIHTRIEKNEIFDWSGDRVDLTPEKRWTPPEKHQFALTVLRSRIAFRNFQVQGETKATK